MSQSTLDDHVQHLQQGPVSCITLAWPKTPAGIAGLYGGMQEAVHAAQADEQVKVILVTGEGPNFAPNARPQDGDAASPALALSQLCDRIEACAKPVVVVMHGDVAGDGLALALAAHHRVVMPTARLSVPGVKTGLTPNGGTLIRLAHLVGAKVALELILSGRTVDAEEAMSLGLVDRLVDADDTFAAGLACAQDIIPAEGQVRRTQDASGLADRDAAQAAIDAAKVSVGKTSRGLLAPFKIIEVVQAALDLSFDEAVQKEHDAYAACLTSPQRAGLMHAASAERQVAQVPEAQSARARLLESVGIVGGGTMGAGIAVSALDAGFPVVMVERDQASIERGRANVEKVYDGLIAKGRLTPEGKRAVMDRYTGSIDYAALAQVDLVVEAVFEDLEAKKTVFRELDRVCKPGAVLATNTSYLDIDAIAASTSRPQDVIGLHFFSPANIMKLLEIVVPAKVDADVVVTAFELARRMKKVPVRAGVCDGFIGNRILAVYKQVADHMMEDGASPYEIDEAVRAFGYPMGPFQVTDLAGGDIGWATRKRRAATRDPRARYVEVADRVCERGWFGQKTGRGFYRYPEGARTGQPDPEVLAIVEAERRKKHVFPRTFTADDIMRRYMAAMINEGAKVVEEGIALRPLDVDVTFLNGYGFPRHRGGPMHYADTVGLATILADIRGFQKEDPLFWQPAKLLETLVQKNLDFSSLN